MMQTTKIEIYKTRYDISSLTRFLYIYNISQTNFKDKCKRLIEIAKHFVFNNLYEMIYAFI